ncbi:MAG: hypothetical protein J7J76_02940, partial [Candidatus Latescibacteria bacterium]|nr:hypothetical protein [Candidatus Latescibacterota bacterium]
LSCPEALIDRIRSFGPKVKVFTRRITTEIGKLLCWVCCGNDWIDAGWRISRFPTLAWISL